MLYIILSHLSTNSEDRRMCKALKAMSYNLTLRNLRKVNSVTKIEYFLCRER